jgi:ABC-type transport system substrate-binding protein
LTIKDDPMDYRTRYIAAGGAYSGNFDGILSAPHAFDGDPHTYLNNHFHSKSGRNIAGVNDPKVDELVGKLSSTFDRNERAKIAREILQYNADQMFYIGVVGGPSYRAVNKRVNNFKWMPDRSEPTDS